MYGISFIVGKAHSFSTLPRELQLPQKKKNINALCIELFTSNFEYKGRNYCLRLCLPLKTQFIYIYTFPAIVTKF